MRKIVLTVVLTLLASAALWSENTADEKAVWKLEEAYWKYVKSNDVKSYRTLWDENFIGWPGFSNEPMEKASIGDWIAPLHKNPDEQYGYELTPKALRSFGDVVVVHYLVRDFYRSPGTGEIVRQLDEYPNYAYMATQRRDLADHYRNVQRPTKQIK
jgi:hypothetical protein